MSRSCAGKRDRVHVFHGARLMACACAVVATAGAAVPPSNSGDTAILRSLRPAQRENLLLVRRDGTVRAIAYEDTHPPFDVAEPQLAALPPIPLERRSMLLPISLPRPALHPSPPVALRPSPRAASSALPLQSVAVVTLPQMSLARLDLVRVVAPRVDLFRLRDGTTFVPTHAIAKPSLRPLPAPAGHDLAWLYAHRFDSMSGDGDVPGVPVRSQVSSPFDIDSGAFHGVRAHNGYSAVRVTVSIPCGVRHFVTGPGYNEVTAAPGIVDQETGYIYIGGWGAGPRGVSVDAGLQKSSAQAEHDDYAFYWKFASNRPVTSDVRFPCGGPDVALELYPVSPSLLVFSATGITDDGERRTLTVVQQTADGDGWIPGGGSPDDGIILKRIVSIAQPWSWHARSGIGKRDRFTSGSYFGVAGPRDLTPRIVWRDCEVGRVVPPSIVPQYQPWTPSETWHATSPGTYTDWPPLDVMHRSDGVCDATGIYLGA
jgi:hypothetical protein